MFTSSTIISILSVDFHISFYQPNVSFIKLFCINKITNFKLHQATVKTKSKVKNRVTPSTRGQVPVQSLCGGAPPSRSSLEAGALFKTVVTLPPTGPSASCKLELHTALIQLWPLGDTKAQSIGCFM